MKKHDDLIPRQLATLDPHQLASAAQEAVREILHEAAAANTTRSYAAALRYWSAWFLGRYNRPIPFPVPRSVVVQFLVDHMPRTAAGTLKWDLPPALDAALIQAGLKKRPGPMALATVVHRIAVLSAAHRHAGRTNPCQDPAVRQLLSQGRRAAHKRGERPSKKTAVLTADLNAMVATCDGSLHGLRDRALLYFGFASGGRRRSEVANATIENLRPLPDGGFLYRLDAGKTLQSGPAIGASPDKPILGAAATALEAWITVAGIEGGPIFRRLWHHTVGSSLSGESVATIVRTRAKLAGLDGEFAGHSLRSGFITEGARRGVALPALMAMTDHRSVASVVGYFQAGAAEHSPAARLHEDS